jgi:hypothetical protein
MRFFAIGIEHAHRVAIDRRTVAMRANSIGTPSSAAPVKSSAAVNTAGIWRSAAGTALTK